MSSDEEGERGRRRSFRREERKRPHREIERESERDDRGLRYAKRFRYQHLCLLSFPLLANVSASARPIRLRSTAVENPPLVFQSSSSLPAITVSFCQTNSLSKQIEIGGYLSHQPYIPDVVLAVAAHLQDGSTSGHFHAEVTAAAAAAAAKGFVAVVC